jgi:hypothetical protein
MLIFVHFPKTSGTSIRTALVRHYGSSLIEDYGDDPRIRSVLETLTLPATFPNNLQSLRRLDPFMVIFIRISTTAFLRPGG